MHDADAKTLADLLEEARRITAGLGAHGGHVQQVNNLQPSPPRAERIVWALAAMVAFLCAGLLTSIVSGLQQGQRITDLRADMHAERASRERFDNWNAQEVTAIRSYITNGRLQPMQPRPEPEPAP